MKETKKSTAEPDFLSNARLAIMGLGLMGGSLALALRGRPAALLGVDLDEAVLRLARKRQVVELASSHPAEILPQADVIILAAPVRKIIDLIRELPRYHPGSAVVLDLGSTKAAIMEAMASLPDRFDPIGGHPMCGKEKTSLAHAEAGIFKGAPFVFTPLSRTTDRARSLAAQIAVAAGAHPVWMDPDDHDRWAASTSHLPYSISSVLACATPAEVAPLVGPGFRSATRLAATSPALMLDILMTNRRHLLAALADFRACLDRLEGYLERGDSLALKEMLDRGASRRLEMVADPDERS